MKRKFTIFIIVCFSWIAGFCQDSLPDKSSKKDFFLEGNICIRFNGDQDKSYFRNNWDVKTSVGYQLKSNLSFGLTFSLQTTHNTPDNQRIYQIYPEGDPEGYNTLRIYDYQGYSWGISPFIRKKIKMIGGLYMNLDLGLEIKNAKNKETKIIRAVNGWEDWGVTLICKSQMNTVNFFLDFGFIYQFHNSLGVSLRFNGFNFEYSTTTLDDIKGMKEIKTTNISLFKNLHEPYVGFIFYF